MNEAAWAADECDATRGTVYQVCGPANAERRLTWVEPYWRGPEDAQIPVRSHVVTGGAP